LRAGAAARPLAVLLVWRACEAVGGACVAGAEVVVVVVLVVAVEYMLPPARPPPAPASEPCHTL